MADTPRERTGVYEAPALVDLGAFAEITLACNKDLGGSDGFTFQNAAIHCTSA
ncbi:MAG: hypothetical protein QOF27_2111 [Gaiellaceae bacterium]|jgi:hypothetical protein|nr:hypothetical protein [Gaiellaceae bacterium]